MHTYITTYTNNYTQTYLQTLHTYRTTRLNKQTGKQKDLNAYKERKQERERERETDTHTHTYIYIYAHQKNLPFYSCNTISL